MLGVLGRGTFPNNSLPGISDDNDDNVDGIEHLAEEENERQ